MKPLFVVTFEDQLEVFDQEFAGRNRRYYKVTERGRRQLALYQQEWGTYIEKINNILLKAENANN